MNTIHPPLAGRTRVGLSSSTGFRFLGRQKEAGNRVANWSWTLWRDASWKRCTSLRWPRSALACSGACTRPVPQAARVWTLCRDLHLAARQQHTRLSRSRCAPCRPPGGSLRSPGETVQMVCHQFLANVEAARDRRSDQPQNTLPLQRQALLPVVLAFRGARAWNGDASSRPLGRGRPSLVTPAERS